MEGFIIFLLIILLAAMFIIPIVILLKINMMKQDMDHLSNDVQNLNKRVMDIYNHTASRDDVQDIMSVLGELRSREPVIATDSPVEETSSFVSEVETEVVNRTEDTLHTIVEETIPEEEIIPTDTVEEEVPEIAATEIIEDEPVYDDEQIVEETPPPFAAFSRHEDDIVVMESVPPVNQFSKSPVESLQEPEKSFIERILGENLLSKIGIVTLVLGIGFFVKYAIDKDWINEIGRVGIGILTGGLLIGIAHKLKEKYHVFSSILVGGGISVFYITITLAFREYGLFSQTVAFILLIAITVFSVVLSLYYGRKELAIFSLLGGFGAPLMVSTGSGNYIVLFSYLLILNSGMLVISYVKKWKEIGIISYVLSLIFFWTWLLSAFNGQFVGAAVFAALFFVQFYLLALVDHFKEKDKVTFYQGCLILTNNLSVFLAFIYIFDAYEYDIRGLVTILVAIANAVVMLAVFRKSEVDRNLVYLLIAIVMSFVSLAIPIQLHGHVITMFWMAETVVLLWLWKKSKIQLFSVGFLVVTVLALVSYIIDLNHNYAYDEDLRLGVNRIFITGIVMVIGFAVNLFILNRGERDSHLGIGSYEIISTASLIKLFKLVVIALVFSVPYLEMDYQLANYTDVDGFSSFRRLVMFTYAIAFVGVLAFIFRNKIQYKAYIFALLFVSVAMYTMAYNYLAIDLRFDIFVIDIYARNYFLIHLVSLLPVAYIVYQLVRNIKKYPQEWFAPFCWGMVILTVAILTIELDHLAVLIWGNADNYDDLLYDVRTFVYPILWGILAMIMMIWGLKGKEVILRKISLVFFGLIIVKFYAYDVWRMSQAGRIISFIILGVILLSVSFLQQKIKTLVKDDEIKKPVDENFE